MSKIDEIFLDIGMKESHLGTGYLRAAIGMYVPGISLTKELYPAVAKLSGSTASRVERAMRHAIEAAFNNDPMYHNTGRYFGNTISAESGKVTLGEFIARIAVLQHED